MFSFVSLQLFYLTVLTYSSVLMWECITMGQQPYAGHTNLEVLQYVRGGGRLPRPNQNCPEEL